MWIQVTYFDDSVLRLRSGLLIGLEHGWRERDLGDGRRAASIRTFALIGLPGGLWGAMPPHWAIADGRGGTGFRGRLSRFFNGASR